MLIGGIEAGGTKFVCAVANDQGQLIERIQFPTGDPDETMERVCQFFSDFGIEALGVGAFGPIDLNKDSMTFGTIVNTPKIKWKNYSILNRLKSTLTIPVYIDTDVNAACLGEFHEGAASDVNSCLYITVGTGIGAGFVQDGNVFQGKNHPEMGHIYIPKHDSDSFKGSCPYHGACLEGLASGTAIEKRYGKKGTLLESNEEVWELEAYYLAQAIVNYVMILSPERIIVGGGVMKQEKLYPMIRQKFEELLDGYVATEDLDRFIVAPGLGDDAGIRGALALIPSDKRIAR